MQELNPKTAVEALENPKNPLNENVNVDVNEKENGYANDTVDEKKAFVDSLILDDFDDEEEYRTCEEGSISDYMQRQFLEEEERKYRYSQSLEEERDTYV